MAPWNWWLRLSIALGFVSPNIRLLQSHLDEIPDDSRKGESLVFLLARPPKTAASFGWSSEDVYELCHWAVLVLNDTVNLGMLKDIIVGLKGGLIRNPSEIQLGFVVEIGRSVSSSPSVLVAKAFQPFTVADLMQHFPNCSMAFVGITTENEASIKARGIQIRDGHPEYQLLSNNCQDWARTLITNITGRNICPQTISDIAWPVGRIWGGTPTHSHGEGVRDIEMCNLEAEAYARERNFV